MFLIFEVLKQLIHHTKLSIMTTINNASESLYSLALSQMYDRKAADAVYDAKLFVGEDQEMVKEMMKEAKAHKQKSIELLEKVELSDLEKYRNKKLTPKSNLSHNDFRYCVIIED